MEEAAQRLLAGDQRILSRLISLLERGDPRAADVLKAIDSRTGRAYTVGITGPPGAGKSTIVDRLTELLRGQGLTVGIVGVDPSSPFSGGALLGDRVRMQRHYLDSGVFIRSVATRGHSGGLSRIVKGIVRLLDAAGTDIILVETVGVGQTELGIVGVADTILLTLMPESGDAIQALKAGVMEVADVFLVNKADREGADHMAAAINGMVQMVDTHSGWTPPVVLTTARSGQGIEELWNKIQAHREVLTATSELARRRGAHRRREFLETVQEELERRLKALVENDPVMEATLEKVANREAEPYSSAMEFLNSSQLPPEWLATLPVKQD
ncbi:MAG: methylmalonyl Co-A mutase-associated GTPase MeaB [Dehalococcoidia bacterium]|jgi:LAO/AO transport system kinase|nr:methylmalonyl Co-A mutase-associated GTPase MeaB [Dehalococcoidia bacterium]MDP6228473.1 methylmalonyl Co-A mutase-associated GTPase MeaB [Dehalococcoidia bacterium]MDP7082810.1 methylmalonyl Co-A mutase-associated GTPase MeaB [Dehalococcoidia bacterium]MDP7200196.1 methylmalonyl Co-A mutase-associated GTPase MeaB [Dehalococcoidia bacterium]MDP7509730.1 methylmalonyl Co-A mutase-associated GTPase MeaB [Dehalococcoidia bacterium]